MFSNENVKYLNHDIFQNDLNSYDAIPQKWKELIKELVIEYSLKGLKEYRASKYISDTTIAFYFVRENLYKNYRYVDILYNIEKNLIHIEESITPNHCTYSRNIFIIKKGKRRPYHVYNYTAKKEFNKSKNTKLRTISLKVNSGTLYQYLLSLHFNAPWMKKLDMNSLSYHTFPKNEINKLRKVLFSSSGFEEVGKRIGGFSSKTIHQMYSMLNIKSFVYLQYIPSSIQSQIHNEKSVFYHYNKVSVNINNAIIYDYLKECKVIKRTPKLIYNNYDEFLKEHSKVSNLHLKQLQLIDKSDLSVGKIYKDFSLAYPKYELIKNTSRLYKEGEIQHHCVASYKDAINDKRCGIYSIVYEDTRYTIELRIQKDFSKKIYYGKPYLVVLQIRGLCNKDAPEALWNILKNDIECFNKKYTSSYNELDKKKNKIGVTV